MKQEVDGTPPSEQMDQDSNEGAVKQEPETGDSKPKVARVSRELVEKLAEVLKNDWEKLAARLGYTSDEVFF